MKFEVPHNSAISTAQYELHYKLSSKKQNKQYWRIIFLGIFFLALSFIRFSAMSSVDYIILGMGISYIIFGIGFIAASSTRKEKFRANIHRMMERRANEIAIYEFNENHFRSKDVFYDQYIQWPAFKQFRIVENNLFLDLIESVNNASIIIGEAELGPDDFKKVVDFVGMKVARGTL